MQVAYVHIFAAQSPGPCRELALVLQSQGIPSQTIEHDGVFQLWVPESDLLMAKTELAVYQSENVNWKPRRERVVFDKFNPWPGLWAYVLLMLFVTFAAGSGLFGLSWFSDGKVNAGLVLDGEWWRTFTALTLHADVGHLAGNLGFGLLFGYFAGQLFGSGVGWLGIVLSGAVGNYINSFLSSSSHTSVGASTAIFGALGLVAAFSWRRKLYPQDRWVGRLGPLIGGIALLAFTGTGGERTDVGAHLTGFVSGIAIGSIQAVWPVNWLRQSRVQWLAGGSAVSLLMVSWVLALL
ncbi:MAG: rhomboid family intramembrane serine protease [Gammaproteobacteria bacterium]